jgi:hypothetical protein
MIALRATIAYTALSNCPKQVAWHGLVAPTAVFFAPVAAIPNRSAPVPGQGRPQRGSSNRRG